MAPAWCIMQPCIQYTASAASMAGAWSIRTLRIRVSLVLKGGIRLPHMEYVELCGVPNV